MSQLYFTIVFLIIQNIAISKGEYKIGVGRADCTGPAAEIVFMGYAKSSQKGCGIHLRQYSRAFLFDDGTNRAGFVSVDSAMMHHGIRTAVIKRLHKYYGSMYNENNLILSGTHTHSTPGGFLMDFMYDIPSYGFIKETFDSLVEGIVRSIVRAHENMVEGEMYFSSGTLLDSNINRSPASYLLNPPEERAKYKYDVDKKMTQLKLIRSSDKSLMGAINWFAVHPTSMNNTNCLLSSDNVGYASILLENAINNSTLPGFGNFVGAFASSNLGDVSPNLKGPHCINSGEACDSIFSTCEDQARYCIASGPGVDMFDSTRIIAQRLFKKSMALLNTKQQDLIDGEIKSIHQFVDMSKENATVQFPDGTVENVKGCLPAMGYSFAAGTTDGPGEFNFHQGSLKTTPFWNTVRDFIFPPTDDDVSCHHPKPILMNTGRISTPYEWQPRIVSTQLIQLAPELVLIAVPGEFTTMAGRRLRETIRNVMAGGRDTNLKTVITGLSNSYSSYVTTPEEYQLQRYEGASTIFGPHTLTLYMKVYSQLARALMKDQPLDPGPSPPDLSTKLISFMTGVMFDSAGWNSHFGDCIVQPEPVIQRGQTAKATFLAGHPRNNWMHEKTFLLVERFREGQWEAVATDANWETKFTWRRYSKLSAGSEAVLEWTIPLDSPSGTYRFRHFGYYKAFLSGIYPYEGTSNKFQVM